MQQLIDAKGKLNHGKIKKFIISANPEIVVNVPEANVDYTLTGESANEKIKSFFNDKEIAEEIRTCSKDLLIQFHNVTDNTLLEFQKIDYTYWTKPGRLEKLLGEDAPTDAPVEEKPAKKERAPKAQIQIPVAVAVRDANGVVSEVETFTGNQKEVVSFLNTHAGELQVKFFEKKTVVYNIAYQSPEELEDLGNWFTFDELVEAGVFTK